MYTTGYYKEPGPILDEDSPFTSMMERFKFAANILELDEGMFKYLASPVKQVIVSIPVVMDSGDIRVFEGYRVIHDNVLGPSKGGIRYAPDVTIEELQQRIRKLLNDPNRTKFNEDYQRLIEQYFKLLQNLEAAQDSTAIN